MTYWKSTIPAYDIFGVLIQPGDIIRCLDYLGDSWEYNGCEDEGTDYSIRDFNAHNIGYCQLGPDGNCVNLGHYSKHYDFMMLNDTCHEWFDQKERLYKLFPNAEEGGNLWDIMCSEEGKIIIGKYLFNLSPEQVKDYHHRVEKKCYAR